MRDRFTVKFYEITVVRRESFILVDLNKALNKALDKGFSKSQSQRYGNRQIRFSANPEIRVFHELDLHPHSPSAKHP